MRLHLVCVWKYENEIWSIQLLPSDWVLQIDRQLYTGGKSLAFLLFVFNLMTPAFDLLDRLQLLDGANGLNATRTNDVRRALHRIDIWS